MAEWYRRNAGIVVFNRQRRVLLCKRNDVKKPSWQFPQGGIEDGETHQQAALRELKEETSLQNVVPIKTLTEPLRYRFPKQILSSLQKRGYTNIGQEMYWTLAFFAGDDSEINLQTAEPEFSAFYWGTLEEACEKIVLFKKPVYEQMSRLFAPLIEQFKIPE